MVAVKTGYASARLTKNAKAWIKVDDFSWIPSSDFDEIMDTPSSDIIMTSDVEDAVRQIEARSSIDIKNTERRINVSYDGTIIAKETVYTYDKKWSKMTQAEKDALIDTLKSVDKLLIRSGNITTQDTDFFQAGGTFCPYVTHYIEYNPKRAKAKLAYIRKMKMKGPKKPKENIISNNDEEWLFYNLLNEMEPYLKYYNFDLIRSFTKASMSKNFVKIIPTWNYCMGEGTYRSLKSFKELLKFTPVMLKKAATKKSVPYKNKLSEQYIFIMQNELKVTGSPRKPKRLKRDPLYDFKQR